jgi:hypothetical protein
MAKYYKIGLPFALGHAILFLATYFKVISSEEAQIQLLYAGRLRSLRRRGPVAGTVKSVKPECLK